MIWEDVPFSSETLLAPSSSNNILPLLNTFGLANTVTDNPNLGPLQDNGGPTWTMRPASFSPAMDAVACAPEHLTDQRGISRPQGTQCDIGAVEVQQYAVTTSAGSNGTLTCPAWITDGEHGGCTATPNSGYHTVSISGCNGTATGARVNSYTTGILTEACTVSATFAADSAPDAPTLSSAIAGDGTVTLTWTAPANSGGSAITGYTVTGGPAGSCTTDASTLNCTISGLANGTEYSFKVVATNAIGDSVASNAATATPLAPPTVLSIPGGNGTASVQISGGPNTCTVVPNSLSINSSPPDAPPGAVFPMGVLHFEANGCANAALTVTVTYSSPIPEAAVPHKYGPPSAGQTPSWFVPSAVTMSNDRHTVSFTVTDNGEGDSNLTLGQIRDPFGPVILASGVAAVPTLAQWGVMLLAALTSALGAGALRRRNSA